MRTNMCNNGIFIFILKISELDEIGVSIIAVT